MIYNVPTNWSVGCNYTPQYAANQLEMWDGKTFNMELINRELSWAKSVGFNSIRVFLHNLIYDQNPEAFLDRVDHFLGIADKHGIKVMFVLFDGVWNPNPQISEVYNITPNVHNSAWVQSPGFEILNDVTRHDELKVYVQHVVYRFKDDPRVAYWDLFNEPDNTNVASYKDDNYCRPKWELALELLKKTVEWVREVGPSQPITMGPWNGNWESGDTLNDLEKYMFETSDVISFHCYGDNSDVEKRIGQLSRYNKPMLCTEYMARPLGSTFEDILPIFKKYNVGAYCWGLTAGKSQTFCPWDSWQTAICPDTWFHDIFHADGTPYSVDEINFLKKILIAA